MTERLGEDVGAIEAYVQEVAPDPRRRPRDRRRRDDHDAGRDRARRLRPRPGARTRPHGGVVDELLDAPRLAPARGAPAAARPRARARAGHRRGRGDPARATPAGTGSSGSRSASTTSCTGRHSPPPSCRPRSRARRRPARTPAADRSTIYSRPVKRSAILVALAALVLPAATHADDSAITLHVLKPKVVFGDRVPLRGRVMPAAAGVRVVAERQGEILAHGRTDSRGLYTIWIRPGRSGTWRTRIAGTDAHSGPVGITVSPQLTITAGEATAFVGAPGRRHGEAEDGRPGDVDGLSPRQARRRAGGSTREASDRPDRRAGLFALRADLGASHARARLVAGARTLSYGSTGPDVVALRQRLLELHVHVPGPSTTFGSELYDSVIAFQKARGLSRTGTSTMRPGGRSPRTSSRRRATRARRTSRSRRAARSSWS